MTLQVREISEKNGMVLTTQFSTYKTVNFNIKHNKCQKIIKNKRKEQKRIQKMPKNNNKLYNNNKILNQKYYKHLKHGDKNQFTNSVRKC